MGRSLSLLPAGRARLDGADPEQLREVIAKLAGDDGLVVIVGAPIQASPVTLALARAADSVILVARRDRSRREDVAFAGESLRLIGAPSSGVILTERGPIRLRRAARADNAPATVAVDVRAPAARAAATAGGRGEPRKRSRATTSRAAPAFPLTEPDDAGLSAG